MKKVMRILLFIFSFLIFLIFLMLMIFIWQKKVGKVPYLFSYTSFIATGNSMNPTINSGDLIIVKKTNHYELNDIIAFQNDENMIITHRIHEISNELYITKGDNNHFIDGYQVKQNDVYGKVVGKINNIGYLLVFIRHKFWLIIFLLISLSILILITTRRKNVR